jgi:hypothetical protein
LKKLRVTGANEVDRQILHGRSCSEEARSQDSMIRGNHHELDGGGCGLGWDGMGWDGMGWDGMGWDGMGWERRACLSAEGCPEKRGDRI